VKEDDNLKTLYFSLLEKVRRAAAESGEKLACVKVVFVYTVYKFIIVIYLLLLLIMTKAIQRSKGAPGLECRTGGRLVSPAAGLKNRPLQNQASGRQFEHTGLCKTTCMNSIWMITLRIMDNRLQN
jgi:hypothetical protein